MNKIINKTLLELVPFSKYLTESLSISMICDSEKNGDFSPYELCEEDQKIIDDWKKNNSNKGYTSHDLTNVLAVCLGTEFALKAPNTEKFNVFVPVNDYETLEFVLSTVCKLTDKEIAYVLNIILEYNNRIYSDGVAYTDDDSKDYKEMYASLYKAYLNLSLDNKKFEDLIDKCIALGMSKEMITGYIEFLADKLEKSIPKNKVEVRNIVPKKTKKPVKVQKGKLKTKLNDLVSRDEFDFNNLEEVLNLLSELNYPDEVVAKTLYRLYPKAVKNDAYYEYIIKKANYMRKYNDKIEELKLLREMYEESDDSDRIEIKQMQQDIYNELELEVLQQESDFETSKLMLEFKES